MTARLILFACLCLPALPGRGAEGVPIPAFLDTAFVNNRPGIETRLAPRYASLCRALGVPDTAALRILGEWVVGQESVAGVRAGTRAASRIPYLRDRILVAPDGWTGQARMLDIRGRVFALEPVGRGRYAIPEAARGGVYFFRFGRRAFKASILR